MAYGRMTESEVAERALRYFGYYIGEDGSRTTCRFMNIGAEVALRKGYISVKSNGQITGRHIRDYTHDERFIRAAFDGCRTCSKEKEGTCLEKQKPISKIPERACIEWTFGEVNLPDVVLKPRTNETKRKDPTKVKKVRKKTEAFNSPRFV